MLSHLLSCSSVATNPNYHLLRQSLIGVIMPYTLFSQYLIRKSKHQGLPFTTQLPWAFCSGLMLIPPIFLLGWSLLPTHKSERNKQYRAHMLDQVSYSMWLYWCVATTMQWVFISIWATLMNHPEEAGAELASPCTYFEINMLDTAALRWGSWKHQGAL